MPRYTFTDIFKLLFTPEVIAPFLVGSLALGVASDAIYDLLKDYHGGGSAAYWQILLLAAIALLIAAMVMFLVLIRRTRERVLVINKPHPATRKGLIVLVSQQDTLRKAFDYHQATLERGWLIATAQSWALATEFKSQHENNARQIELLLLRDEFDWQECKTSIDKVFQQLPAGWQNDDVITDFTGLTKLATAGAILASLVANRPMQYVPGIYEERDGKRVAVAAADPIEIIMDRRLILQSPRDNQ